MVKSRLETDGTYIRVAQLRWAKNAATSNQDTLIEIVVEIRA